MALESDLQGGWDLMLSKLATLMLESQCSFFVSLKSLFTFILTKGEGQPD